MAPVPLRDRRPASATGAAARAALLAAVVGLAPGALGGCAPRARGPTLATEVPLTYRYAPNGVPVVLTYASEDAVVVDEVRAALAAALPRVTRWGPLRHPVTIRIQPDHAALEAAADRPGYPWLRAWARYDEVLLQSPATFGLFEGGQRALRELLTHELTHCLMYQLAADRRDWERRDAEIPLWFREGMASWTAGQGHRRMAADAVAEWMAASGRHPLEEADALYRDHMRAVYGAAHHAFARLVLEHGEGAVRGILSALRSGAPFDAAFRRYTGRARSAFEAGFGAWLVGEPPPRLTRPTRAGGSSTAGEGPADAPRPSAGAGAPPR